jgi:hypothetical protein
LIVSLKGRAQRLPCLVVDSSQGGLRLRGSFRLKMGQVVEVLSDDGFWTAPCRVIWIGKPRSKQEGEAGYKQFNLRGVPDALNSFSLRPFFGPFASRKHL